MNTKSSMAALVGAMLLTGCAFDLHAQSFSIDWFKIAGGGGTSTNAQLSLSGTIGQPDAGPAMTNGQFSVTGGFWALPTAVQTPGAPTVTITPGASGFAVITWAPNSPGYVLQETLSLSPANWTNSVSGSNNPATIPAFAPKKFYRLLNSNGGH